MAKTRYANAEIHLTEWSSSPSISDYAHDFPQEATYIVKVNLDCIGLAQSLSYWTFSDVFEEAGGSRNDFQWRLWPGELSRHSEAVISCLSNAESSG